MPFHLKTDVAIFRATLGIIWGIAYYNIWSHWLCTPLGYRCTEKNIKTRVLWKMFFHIFCSKQWQWEWVGKSWPVKVLQFFLKKIWILFSPTHCLLTLIWSLLSAISIQQTLGTDRKDIIWLESVKMGASVTRFGDTVPLWQSFKSVWQFLKPSLAFVEILNLIG